MALAAERVELLEYWMSEREKVRRAKAMGAPKPWTLDPILQSTRFCNVRRMDDKVSLWLLDNWYPKVLDRVEDAGQVLAAAGAARLLNWPDTLEVVITKDRGSWDWHWPDRVRALRAYRDAGNKIFTGAYIINGAMHIGAADKIETVCRQIDTMYNHGELIDTDSMQNTHANLMRIKGIGSFMAGQIVADLRHVWPGDWADRHTWAPLGPGSRRGMAWLEGWDGTEFLPSMRQAYFEEQLSTLRATGLKRKTFRKIYEDRQLEAHDLQNCLCEFDKFMRLKTGTGRAKNQYPGRA